MKTVTVKFVVNDNDETELLFNEIEESIGNPLISTRIEDSTEAEIKSFKYWKFKKFKEVNS